MYNLNALGKIQEGVDNPVLLGRSMRPIDISSSKGFLNIYYYPSLGFTIEGGGYI